MHHRLAHRFLLSARVVACLLPCLLLALHAGEAPAQAAGGDFPQGHSDLAPDPKVQWGRLDNGLRYCLMVNNQPQDKVSLRLFVGSGSLLERDEQRGLAHFLEHMAFNGTTHYPPGKLVSVLQGLGLAFGADTNAHTSFDETVYKLDLPDPRGVTLATGLQVMADYAGGMLILPAEVNRERGVILAEMRDRDNPGFRQWQTIYRAYYPGLLIPERFAIGVRSTVEQADAALLKDYFDSWYRPERMVLAVTGALDPISMAEKVRAAFVGVSARRPAPAQPAIGTPQKAGFAVTYHREAEAAGTTLSLTLVRARARPHDSMAFRREQLVQALGERILSHRFRDLIAKHPDGPLIEAAAESYQWLDLFHAGVQAKLRAGGAYEAVAVVVQEARRFLEFGPTAGELAVVRKEIAAELDEAVAHTSNRSNADLADALYRALRDDEVFLSPQQERDLLLPMLAAADAQAVRQIWAQTCPDGHLALVVTGADDLGSGAEDRLAAAFKAAQAVKLEPPLQRQAMAWAYGERPAPGTWLGGHDRLPGGVWPGELGNRVAVRLKRNDSKPNEVLVQCRIAIPAAPYQAGLREFAERAFLAGGLGRHSADELRDVLAGSSVHLGGPRFDEDGFSFSASCLPKELELCFQELRAYLTDPGWRADGEQIAKAEWRQQLQSLGTNLDAQVGRTFKALAVAGAPQRRDASPEEAELMSFALLKPWLTPYLAGAALTLNVVGDMADEAQTADLAAAYFGSLPARDPIVGAVVALPAGQGMDTSRLAAAPPLPSGLHRIAVPGTVARALIDVAWPTEDFYDIGRTRRLGVLAGVLDERMRVRIRQELGDAYSPYAMRFASEAYRGFGYLIAQVGVAPAKVEEGRTALLQIAQELVDQGVSEELLAQVKTPIIKNLQALRQQNQYWLSSVLSRCASQPFRLEWAQGMEADYAAITSAEIAALAKRYLINGKALQVVGVCTGAAGAGEAKEAK